MSLNKVQLIGRLGEDPKLSFTPSQSAVCNFSVATTMAWFDKHKQKQEKTEWHKIVAWEKLAETCSKYLQKGRLCYVEGRLETRKWEDKNGTTRYITEVIAQDVKFLDSAKESDASSRGQVGAGASTDFGGLPPTIKPESFGSNRPLTDDEIPF